MKLVMTLLVRDEVDIIEKNICFHLNNGVDFIIVTDNGSIDGTREILKKYEKKGAVFVIDQPKHNLKQDIWVSKMAALAIDKYHADYLVHSDADEFWIPKKGNLKDCILKNADLMFINVINYLPSLSGNFVDSKYIVSNGIVCPDNFYKKNSNMFLLYRYHPKIITSSKYRNITKGNHMVVTNENVQRISNNNIFIHHFPIRSYSQFKNKVILGGLAVKERKDTDSNTSWQRKKWFKLYKQKKLYKTYRKIGLFKNEELYIRKKILKKSTVPRSIRYAEKIHFFKNFFNF